MFAKRLRLVAAGAALVMSASLTVASSATAEPAAPEAKDTRTVRINGVEPRPNVFFAKGRVLPAYEKKPAIMQRKVGAARWKTYKRFTTSAKSRFRVRIAALRHRGRVHYRVKVPGNKKFKNSFSAVLTIRTF